MFLILLISLPFVPQQLPGGEWSTQFDQAVSNSAQHGGPAGDVNRDGRPDFFVDQQVRSGLDASLIWEFPGSVAAAAGDVDGDGYGDVLAGDWLGGAAHLYSGATGLLIRSYVGTKPGPFGWAVASAGDVDGDGTPDQIVGQPDWQGWIGEGDAYVYSGASGALIYHLTGTAAGQGDNFGWSVDGGDDLDGDGTPDFVIGEPGIDTGGVTWAFSGATGVALWSVTGAYGGFDDFGESVSLIDDIDSDGRADVIVGARNEQTDRGGLYALSGATGAVIWRKEGQAGERLGAFADAAGDIDGDGDPDVVASTSYGPPAWVAIFSGNDGRMIKQFTSGALMFACATGDLDGDGRDNVYIGHLYDFVVHRFDPFLTTTNNELSVAGGTPTVPGILFLQMQFPLSEAGKPFRMMISHGNLGPSAQVHGLPIPLRPSALFTQTLNGQLNGFLFNGQGNLTSQAQATSLVVTAPALSSFIGLEFRFAAATFDPVTQSGRVSSGAIGVTVVP